jgi:predicted RNA-binding protein associated with RNAse of E/G family
VTPTARWSPGDAVVLREVWRGRIWTGRPVTVVADEHDALMFFVPVGARGFVPHSLEGAPLHAFVDVEGDAWEVRPTTWTETNALSFAEEGRPHATLAFWDAAWGFLGWYVNLQTPLRRTPIGFDYLDQELDAWIRPDGSWGWKDEDELERSVGAGIWTPAEAERLRREGEDAVERVVRGRPPFDRDWSSWRPDPAWRTPELPPGWDLVEA